MIFVDELMGVFDLKVVSDLLNKLIEFNDKRSVSIVMVMYDLVVVSYCSKVIFIKDG